MKPNFLIQATSLLCLALVASLGRAVPLALQATDGKANDGELERQFQSAVAHYEAKEYAAAEQELEALVKKLPGNFEVNELMGLACASQGQDEKARPYLERAVSLKPDSAQAHTSLAINLVRLKHDAQAEAEFHKAVGLEPQSYGANHNLGEFYIRAGKLPEAIPYLERAQKADPSSYENGYDLALAYFETQDLASARGEIQALLGRHETADLHNLLGEVEEKSGNYVTAVREYERAAHMDPSEKNLFDWGSELLLHQALDPAIEVFNLGVKRYPGSARMEVGLGIAYYGRSRYDDAVKALSLATDLNPSDSRPYLFLAKAYNVSTAEAEGVIERLERFAQLEPRSAQAQYYYATSLWKRSQGQEDTKHTERIEALFRRAITLDPKFPDPHLQLGILYADQHKYPAAMAEYEEAIKLDPDLADAHYRLGQALVRAGEKARAQGEFAVYQRLHNQQMAQVEKQRSEIKQFVYTMRDDSSGKGRQ